MLLSTASILQRVLWVHMSMHPMLPMLLKILWSYKKDQTARLQTLFQTSGTFREKKGTGHYTTALTTLDKVYSHRNSYILIYFCTEGRV